MLFWLLACEATTDTAQDGPVVSDDGLYELVLTHTPDPPIAGDSTLLIELTAGGATVEGAVVDVEPWMPAHEHGISDAPVVTDDGGGLYTAAFAYSMSGTWELHFDISADAGDDTAMTTLEVQ